jgi:hypothetical protein
MIFLHAESYFFKGQTPWSTTLSSIAMAPPGLRRIGKKIINPCQPMLSNWCGPGCA